MPVLETEKFLGRISYLKWCLKGGTNRIGCWRLFAPAIRSPSAQYVGLDVIFSYDVLNHVVNDGQIQRQFLSFVHCVPAPVSDLPMECFRRGRG
jgi:hypothetical protein